MSNPLTVTNSITIAAPAATVWEMLVNPEQTKKYMFGCEALSDWQPGSPLLWKGFFDGVEVIAVKGNVVEIIPGKKLVYTVLDPNSDIPDLPENYLTVTYELTENNGSTTLTTTQGDYATVAKGQERYDDTVKAGGWQSILVAIRDLVEKK
ncbi:SRPBCC family protein [Chitinophaga vietnamensis]|uniref:SRPBCC family protein n=1 Tax=Chitinophaga vietnamensis TaxID=2593957 RepID=UPI001178C0C6|nr:SRPBCC domain-containing protein [Chitinophaga vietnamensis]